MSISSWQVPIDQQPKFVKKEFPAGWFEVVVDNFKDYVDLINWLDRMCTGEFDIHQARPFQAWPRVYYVGFAYDNDVFKFKLVWEDSDEALVGRK